ncbi:efflux RND transporter periplasmic adaptor subunit [Candidatus Amarolinea dominans]|uniref:efflux RND transporter periplasmic adaptor subunit n=1 Tax=Candidatus Amarolinea dominans TaxID=3140696 RepID=UPI001D6F4F52|nr:efflux RND transporter periplasmic adaptor subunit [Anaerolineae bacterium]
MKRNGRLMIGIVIVTLVVAGGGYWTFFGRAATASSVSARTYTQVVAVTQGRLNATLSVVGQLEAEQSADLAFERMSGTTNLLTLAVQAGNVVTAGQVLATIDQATYEQARDQARSDLQAAEETLSDLQTPATALAIAQADVAVAAAQVQLQQAQDTLDALVNPDLPSLKAAVASAQSALATAQADVLAQQEDSAARKQLARLQTAEATPTADYQRLAVEEYTDDYYRDRLQVAYNKMMDAQDTRVTYQISRQVSALQAQMTLRRSQQALADAQEALAEAQAGGDKLALAQAELALHQAEVALQAAQEARTDLDTGADATKIAAAQAAVDKKRLTLGDAEAALAGAQLLAPFAGTILQTNVNVDNQVTANTTILTLANLKSLQVVASVDETTIRQISAGQDATITFDAFPGQSLQGKVLTVPLQGSLQGGVMVYAVPVSLSGADNLALLVGMTANVEIQVGQAADALLVPTLALTKANGLYQVLVPNTTDPNGDPVAVPVEIGLSDGAYTQIVKGLNPGDQVVVQIASTTSSPQMMGGPGGMGAMDGGAPPAPPSSAGGTRP